MPIDPQRIGELAMHFMEQLEQKYGPDATIEALVFLAAVDTPTTAAVEFHRGHRRRQRTRAVEDQGHDRHGQRSADQATRRTPVTPSTRRRWPGATRQRGSSGDG